MYKMYKLIRSGIHRSARLSQEIQATEAALQTQKQCAAVASSAFRQQFYQYCRQPSTRVTAFLAGFFTGLLPSPRLGRYGKSTPSLAASLLALGLRSVMTSLLTS